MDVAKAIRTYVLLIDVSRNLSISTGALGYLSFKRGCYAYAGSAKITEIWVGKGSECGIARSLGLKGYRSVRKFGSSDCHCLSHLFYAGSNDALKPVLLRARFKAVLPAEAQSLQLQP